MGLVLPTSLNCCMSTLCLVHYALLLTCAYWKSNNTNARLVAKKKWISVAIFSCHHKCVCIVRARVHVSVCVRVCMCVWTATFLHSVSYTTLFFWHPHTENPTIQTQDSWLFCTFSCFGHNIWNSLPQDLYRHCSTLSSFNPFAITIPYMESGIHVMLMLLYRFNPTVWLFEHVKGTHYSAKKKLLSYLFEHVKGTHYSAKKKLSWLLSFELTEHVKGTHYSAKKKLLSYFRVTHLSGSCHLHDLTVFWVQP